MHAQLVGHLQKGRVEALQPQPADVKGGAQKTRIPTSQLNPRQANKPSVHTLESGEDPKLTVFQ